MYTNLEKIKENVFELQIDQEPETCFKIFIYIALYCNYMKINNITRSKSTLVDNCTIYHFHVTIEADRADIRKLVDYLHE
jgi:hypothetical protein